MKEQVFVYVFLMLLLAAVNYDQLLRGKGSKLVNLFQIAIYLGIFGWYLYFLIESKEITMGFHIATPILFVISLIMETWDLSQLEPRKWFNIVWKIFLFSIPIFSAFLLYILF